LLAALDSSLTREALNRLIFGSLQERVYADGGHALDLSNKAFELLDFIGWGARRGDLPAHCGVSNPVAIRKGTRRLASAKGRIELIRESEKEAEEDLRNALVHRLA
jgi:hypothetical protein